MNNIPASSVTIFLRRCSAIPLKVNFCAAVVFFGVGQNINKHFLFIFYFNAFNSDSIQAVTISVAVSILFSMLFRLYCKRIGGENQELINPGKLFIMGDGEEARIAGRERIILQCVKNGYLR